MERREFLFIATAALLAGCASQGGSQSSDSSGMRFSDSERGIIEALGNQPRRRVHHVKM